MTLKMVIKKGISLFYQMSGTFDRLCLHKKAFALMYHRVVDRNGKNNFVQPGMFVDPCTLENHILVLEKKFTILSLSELISRIINGKNCDGCCVLTFDDGWLDNYTDAFPLLQKYEIPATIFLTTGYIGTDRHFWPEEVIYYLRRIENEHISECGLLHRLFAEMNIKIKNNHFYDQALEIMKRWQPVDREELLNEFRRKWQFLTTDRKMMNWDEVKEMAESGLITFGAHTANHVILDQVPLAEAEKEIVQSRDDIKSHLGIAPEFFAYPNGNYNHDISKLLKKHGFKAAVTTEKGQLGSDVDVFEIPRIGMHEDISNSESMFLARIILKRF